MMKALTTLELAKRNIRNKPQRTVAMSVLTLFVCLILFLSSFTIFSLKNGITSLGNRMGADIIVVPEGYDAKITGAILRGEPNTFFFHEKVLDRIREIEGVEEATPQLFLATLSAGCCSYPIQVIGMDMESDFVVLPWLRGQVSLPLEEREVLVGHHIVGNYNEAVKFFNREFHIKGRLQETGMGFDTSVFMPIDAARDLAKEFEKLLGNEEKNVETSYSSVMIRVRSGYDGREVQRSIREAFRGEAVYPLLSKQMMSEVSKSMNGILTYLYIQIGLIWTLAFAILGIVYSFSVKERKRELATLRILGATQRKLKSILFTEVFLINCIGAVIGAVFGLIVALLFSQAISGALDLPFLRPSFPVLASLFVLTVLLGTSMGPLSAFRAIHAMNRREVQVLLREND